MTVVIDTRCTACGLCLLTCPTNALVRAPKRPAVIDAACIDCLACIEVCPVDAITEVPGTPEPFGPRATEVLRDLVPSGVTRAESRPDPVGPEATTTATGVTP